MTAPTITTRDLGLPEGTRRIWRDERTGGVVLRPIAGLGPRGHVPIGYVTPDDTIVTEYPASMSDKEIDFVALFHTGENKTITDTAAMTVTARMSAGRFGTCRLCGNVHGRPHAATCAHAGKNVGDKVR